jgi:RNA polymerase primary sigma factor
MKARADRKGAEEVRATWFRDIARTPLLRADEERELAERVQAGDVEARERFILANLRLVVHIARRYLSWGRQLEDLIEEGNLGLLHAVETFDPSRGNRFSTYARFWIQQSIRRLVVTTDQTIRFPAYAHTLLNKWRRAAKELAIELGRTPTDKEVAQRLRLSPKKISIVKKARRIQNFSAQGGEEDPIGKHLADDGQGPERAFINADELKRVRHLLGQLDERSRTVLRLRFGLEGEEQKTLQQVGDQLDMTRERVRQIEKKALAQLAEMIQAG